MLPFHFERFDVVTSVAAISLKFWIMTNARDGFDQLHRLAAAEARDWTARFVFWFTGIRHADSNTKVYAQIQYGCIKHHVYSIK
jgi:hypothetical protein